MPDLTSLVDHWGYAAIFLAVVLGNVGLPVPEETILMLAGYLVWAGRLRPSLVLAVGIASATAGDNLGYWLGRRYGSAAIQRHGQRVFLTPERFASVQRFILRYGPLGVFVARFLPGLRFLAGPVAGATGLPVLQFLVANLLGATAYVPVAVGAGYAVGYGLGNHVERLGRIVGEIEHLVLAAAILGTTVLLVRRALRARRNS